MTQDAAHRRLIALPLPDINLWQGMSKFGVILMDLSWVLPWFQFMTRPAVAISRLQFYLVFGAILVGSGLLIYAALVFRFHERARMGVLVLTFLTSLAFGFISLVWRDMPLTLSAVLNRWAGPYDQIYSQLPLLVLTLLLSALAWRRGAVLAMRSLGPLGAMRSFRLGIVMFIFYGLVSAQVGAEPPDVELFIFIFSGLIAMSAGRFSFLGHTRGSSKAPFRRRLVVAVAILAAGMVALMLLVGLFSRGAFAEGLRQLMLFLFSVVSKLLLLLVKPVIFFIVSVFEWIFEMLQPYLDRNGEVLIAPSLRDGIQELLSDLDPQMTPPLWFSELSIWMRRVFIWGVVILVVMVLFYGIRRRLVRFPTPSEEERQSLVGRKDLARMLISMLRRRGRGVVAALQSLGPGERIFAAMRIRRIYAELLELCAQLGHSRPVSRTPTEFLPQLTSLFPSLEQEVTHITQAYVRVRYGELPEYKEHVEAIDAAWSRVRDEGERQKRERRRLLPNVP